MPATLKSDPSNFKRSPFIMPLHTSLSQLARLGMAHTARFSTSSASLRHDSSFSWLLGDPKFFFKPTDFPSTLIEAPAECPDGDKRKAPKPELLRHLSQFYPKQDYSGLYLSGISEFRPSDCTTHMNMSNTLLFNLDNISFLAKCRKLRWLDLSKNPIGNEAAMQGLVFITNKRSNSLQFLSLSSCDLSNIDPAIWQKLITQQSVLEDLELNHCNLDSEHGLSLAKVICRKQRFLQELHMSNNPNIEPHTLMTILSVLKGKPEIRVIDMDGCQPFTKGQVRDVSQALRAMPGLQSIILPKGSPETLLSQAQEINRDAGRSQRKALPAGQPTIKPSIYSTDFFALNKRVMLPEESSQTATTGYRPS
jgi:hypothetical protein